MVKLEISVIVVEPCVHSSKWQAAIQLSHDFSDINKQHTHKAVRQVTFLDWDFFFSVQFRPEKCKQLAWMIS